MKISRYMFYVFVFVNCNKYWVFVLIAKLLIFIWSIKSTPTQLHQEPKDKAIKTLNQNLYNLEYIQHNLWITDS